MPRLFVLLSDSYYLVPFALRDFRANNRPATCLMEFEKSSHNSFVSLFPPLEVAGCVFHRGQSVWKKICALRESRG